MIPRGMLAAFAGREGDVSFSSRRFPVGIFSAVAGPHDTRATLRPDHSMPPENQSHAKNDHQGDQDAQTGTVADNLGGSLSSTTLPSASIRRIDPPMVYDLLETAERRLIWG